MRHRRGGGKVCYIRLRSRYLGSAVDGGSPLLLARLLQAIDGLLLLFGVLFGEPHRRPHSQDVGEVPLVLLVEIGVVAVELLVSLHRRQPASHPCNAMRRSVSRSYNREFTPPDTTVSWNSMGPTPTPTRTLGIAYRVQYAFTRVHAHIHNGQPREDRREEKRPCRSSRRTSRRGLSCVSGSRQAQRTRRLPREDPRAEVDEHVRVGFAVGVGPKEAVRNSTVDDGRCDLPILLTAAGSERALIDAQNFPPNDLHTFRQGCKNAFNDFNVLKNFMTFFQPARQTCRKGYIFCVL